MGFIGKSEEELKRITADLDKRQADLDNRESDVSRKENNLAYELSLLAADKNKFTSERSDHTSEFKRNADSIAAEKAELEKCRSEITLMEAESKANFAGAQREVFKEVIEKRIAELDARQMELDGLEKRVSEKFNDYYAAEGEIARRELAVTEREQKGDAGFADKAKALADEATRQHRANQAEADRLRKHADAIAEERQSLEVAKGNQVQRDQSIIASEQKRDAGFADERAALDVELRDKRKKMETEIAAIREQNLYAIEDESGKLKTERLKDVTKTEQAERDRIGEEIAKERESWKKQQDDARKQLETERTELERQKGAVSALQSESAGRNAELEIAERTLERKEQRLEQRLEKKNDELDESVKAGIDERHKSIEFAEADLIKDISRLRVSLRSQTELLGAFNQLSRQLGGKDPAEIIRELNSQTDELKRLREELATRPTEEMRERYQALESEAKTQKARADRLEKQIAADVAAVAEVEGLSRENSKLCAENKSLAQQRSIFEGQANQYADELKRLRAAYERPAEVDARNKEIEMPHIKADKVKPPVYEVIKEVEWLEGIGNACDSYGLHFNPRILKAFHTALKTAEWSPLTVLAGVSGTGKSELPRLYSHFGGLMFEPLSVQPNWDSQESMLGFFNSIDNRFDTQPVLRFLAQSQKKWAEKTNDTEGYPGLEDSVCLVLLDEINIAYPELYFAEFLSKLELRRGLKGTDVPCLPVKIGAKCKDYQLRLGRNVLWAGTMNQDETTKSLSDKVLDRSIIITFPRPTELRRRLKLTSLDDNNRGPALHIKSWQDWLALGSDFSDEQVKPFKEFLEEMNLSLAASGRAIGHRVWQSIEYYMANYPDVRVAQKAEDKDALDKAMHTAFEDQLVQKVMPKLRGIDTRGKSKTECLDKIRGQIVAGIGDNRFNLAEDFDLACELGYGQFIWQSANYLNDSATDTNVLAASPSAGTTNADSTAQVQPIDRPSSQTADVDLSQPPKNYMPDAKGRTKKWTDTSERNKKMWIDSDKHKKS